MGINGKDNVTANENRGEPCMDKWNDREAAIIRQRRTELGLSQQDIATEVGMQVQQYQRFEYGERKLSRTSLKQALRICMALELDPYEIAFEDGKDMAAAKANG